MKKIYLIESKIRIEADSGKEAISILHDTVKPICIGMEVMKTTCVYEPLPVKKIPLWVLETGENGLPIWSYARDAKGNILYKEGNSIFK